MRIYDHWIDGKQTTGNSGELVTRTSPAHGQEVASFAAGNENDVNLAVGAAVRVYKDRTWSAKPASEKATVLNKLADLMESRSEELARIEAEEASKPITFARGEIAAAIEMARYAASLIWQLHGEAHNQLGPDAIGLVTREPRGVVAMIVPWNFPLVTTFEKLPYALAAGNSVVIKPSELTSGTVLEVAAMTKEAGLPDGVFNVVTGAGEAVGEPLSRHQDVNMISFTGSTRVGTAIAASAGRDMRRISMELGGKAANIVFADADIEAALDGVLFGTMLNQGEECMAGTRLLIDETIADEFVEKLVERAKKLRMGQPLDENAQVTALIHEDHMNKVLDYIAIGKKEGANVAVGGNRRTDSEFAKGCYVETTLFTNVTPNMRIFREEIFGPVSTVTTFQNVDEAVALANNTDYGLANGLWTKDVDKAVQVSQRLLSGVVFVNTFLETAVQLPKGGFKRSGVGRENGIHGLLEFTEIKSTFIKMGPRKPIVSNE